FTRLVDAQIPLIPRVPLIPGFTLNEENFRQILAFLAPFKLREIHLLPFHQFGEPKYHLLGKKWSMSMIKAPAESEIQPFRTLAERAGFSVTIGG
ncbi:[formate-C-acetyltransferase]-activating enzyme, partial [Klebsiella oxytoca]|nr:[formate-C-acetyltransferase]-activating enzyme [Klebsiella oxytoca]